MAKDNNFNDILKILENDYATVADDGTSADVVGYIDSGSYALNALASGSIHGGLPANKITAIAGEEATGKTFFALALAKAFLNSEQKGLVIIFETEGSITKEIIVERGIDPKKVLVVPIETIQQFKTQSLRIVKNHLETPNKDRRPLFFILDSLGMLSTSKEMGDTETGKEVKDMTRTSEIKAAFRVLTLKLSKAKIPMVVTNHVYQTMGMFPTKEMGGGCLVYGTKIILSNGNTEEIQNIKIGDYVHTLLGPQIVSNTFIFNNKDVYEVEFDDGSKIRCSGEHKFLINGSWISVVDLVDQNRNTCPLNIEVQTILKDNIGEIFNKQIHEMV